MSLWLQSLLQGFIKISQYMNHKEKKMCGVISSIIIIEMACFVGKRVSVECDVIYFRMYLTDM